MTAKDYLHFLMLFRGTLLAYAAHLSGAIDKVNNMPAEDEIEEFKPSSVDLLELFYKMCDKEDIPKPLAKKYKVMALEQLGVM